MLQRDGEGPVFVHAIRRGGHGNGFVLDGEDIASIGVHIVFVLGVFIGEIQLVFAEAVVIFQLFLQDGDFRVRGHASVVAGDFPGLRVGDQHFGVPAAAAKYFVFPAAHLAVFGQDLVFILGVGRVEFHFVDVHAVIALAIGADVGDLLGGQPGMGDGDGFGLLLVVHGAIGDGGRGGGGGFALGKRGDGKRRAQQEGENEEQFISFGHGIIPSFQKCCFITFPAL